MNCQSNPLWRKALREDLDLAGIMKAGRALELSEVQAKDLENKDKTVNAVKPPQKRTQLIDKQRHPQNRQGSRNRDKSRKCDRKCRNCGGIYLHRETAAPRRTISAPHVAN